MQWGVGTKGNETKHKADSGKSRTRAGELGESAGDRGQGYVLGQGVCVCVVGACRREMCVCGLVRWTRGEGDVQSTESGWLVAERRALSPGSASCFPQKSRTARQRDSWWRLARLFCVSQSKRAQCWMLLFPFTDILCPGVYAYPVMLWISQ